MNLLLIQPAPPFPELGDALPLGLVSITSFLRKEKIDVRLIDLGKEDIPRDFIPDVVGIGAATPYFNNALFTSKRIKKLFPGAKIVPGGPHVSALPQDAFPYADAVVRGEGELAMLDICRGGISGKIINGTPLQNLDDIPPPGEDLLEKIYKGRTARLHVIGAAQVFNKSLTLAFGTYPLQRIE